MDERTKAELASLVEATGRSMNYLLNKAIEQYLSRQVWQVRRVEQALTSVEAGRIMPHNEVVAEFARDGLFTQEEYDEELREAHDEMARLAGS